MSTVIVASGYFDPLHVGHIEYLEKAKEAGDYLVVIVNNDIQAKLKKGYSFMSEQDRVKIIESLECVDSVVLSKDKDESVKKTLAEVQKDYMWDTLIFAKGGDRHIQEIPEADVCRKLGIYTLEGLGDKVRSSSELVKRIKEEPNE